MVDGHIFHHLVILTSVNGSYRKTFLFQEFSLLHYDFPGKNFGRMQEVDGEYLEPWSEAVKEDRGSQYWVWMPWNCEDHFFPLFLIN